MRKLTVNTFLSVDGVMQAPGGPEEDRSGGFEYGGWSVPFFDEVVGQRMDDYMGKPFDLLLGRRTYEIFAAHWPHAGDEPPAPQINGATKYVASRTMKKADWDRTVILGPDVPAEVKRLKQEKGPEIQVHGSGNLLQTLLQHDLVDEFQLVISPVVLGRGKRLFAEGAIPAGLKLLHSVTSPSGVLIARYARDGAVRQGSFALEQPTEAELRRREEVAAAELHRERPGP